MSRILGGQGTAWGTGAWSGAAGAAPYLGTWNTKDVSGLAGLYAGLIGDTNGGSAGVTLTSHSPGDPRFAVFVHDPTINPNAVWGTATWGAPTDWLNSVGGWLDITALVRGITWKQGATSPGALGDVGTATATLANTNGTVSPWATSGAYTRGGVSLFRVGRLVRFGSVTGTTFTPYFTGRIESMQEDTSGNVDGWLDVQLAELTAELAIYGPAYAIPDGNQLAATMLQLLEHAGWVYQDFLEAPEADVPIMGTTIGGYQSSAYVKSLLELLAAGLWWGIISDGAGRVRAVPRHRAQTNSGLSFSNQPAGAELPLAVVKPYANTDRLLNQATASRLNGSLITATNSDSVTKYGAITDRYEFPRSDLLLKNDSDLSALLALVVSFYGFDDIALDTVTLDLDMAPATLLPAMDALAINGLNGYGFSVRWVHPSGSQYVGYYIASGITWTLTMEGSQARWTADLSIEAAL